MSSLTPDIASIAPPPPRPWREDDANCSSLPPFRLERPFRGLRTHAQEVRDDAGDFDRVRGETARLAEAYSVRMRETEFFAYETAVHLLGGPLPVAIGRELRDLDVGVHGDAPLPRCAGVRGRRFRPHLASVVTRRGIRMSSPASTWAMLGTWSVPDLVALGDFLCRVWREGYGRRNAGTPPLATPDQLRAALDAGKRRGAARLRAAGWAVVQVTSALHAEPARLVTRVESHLSARGWRR